MVAFGVGLVIRPNNILFTPVIPRHLNFVGGTAGFFVLNLNIGERLLDSFS